LKLRPFDDGVALSPASAARLQDTDFAMIRHEVLGHRLWLRVNEFAA
jgi:hypothetical protein